jgi:hypothetical protein
MHPSTRPAESFGTPLIAARHNSVSRLAWCLVWCLQKAICRQNLVQTFALIESIEEALEVWLSATE